MENIFLITSWLYLLYKLVAMHVRHTYVYDKTYSYLNI
jgi:hypothetical protein